MSEQSLREIITLADKIKAKAIAALPAISIVVPDEPEEPSGPVCNAVDIQEAIKDLRPGQTLNVRPGVFYGDLDVEGKPGCTIRAIEPGATRISGLWPEADRGEVGWREKWGAWAARHGDSFLGSWVDEFLFRYDKVDDLKAETLLDHKKTTHGYAHRGNELFVRLPGDVNPNGQPIKLCDKRAQTMVEVANSPGLTLDGFQIEGSGNADAIRYDTSSEDPVLRNCVFTHSRRAARLPHGALVEWCDYSYTGFWRFYQQLVDLNGEGTSALFDLVKDYWKDRGAALEGGFAETVHDGGSERCEFRYNFFHETFDGQRMGAFIGADSHHNVYYRNVDNHIEFEYWQREKSTAKNHEHHSLLLDCPAGPVSHQDNSGGMIGPHYLSHSIVANRDVHSPFMVKLLDLQKDVIHAHNRYELRAGHADGWDMMNAIAAGMKGQDVPRQFRLYNSVFAGDAPTPIKGAPEMKGNARVEGIEAIDMPKGWPVERYAFIGPDVPDDLSEWPRPKRRVFDR